MGPTPGAEREAPGIAGKPGVLVGTLPDIKASRRSRETAYVKQEAEGVQERVVMGPMDTDPLGVRRDMITAYFAVNTVVPVGKGAVPRPGLFLDPGLTRPLPEGNTAGFIPVTRDPRGTVGVS